MIRLNNTTVSRHYRLPCVVPTLGSAVDHDIYKDKHPKPLRPFLSEIDAFARHCHYHILHSVLR